MLSPTENVDRPGVFGVFIVSLGLMTEGAPQGPGWYLIGRIQEGDTGANLTRKLSIAQAEEIGRSFESTIPPSEEVSVHPFAIIKAGSDHMRDQLKAELAQAEAAATNIASLRHMLEELGGQGA